MNQIKVQLDSQTSHSYKIHIGRDIIDRVGVLLNKGNWINRYVIITDSRVNSPAREKGVGYLETDGFKN